MEGEDWIFLNSRLLKIKSNNISISGTADSDLKIECENEIQLSMKDLKQDNHKLYILALDDLTIDVSGNNELTWISGEKAVSIRGNQRAELLLSSRANGKDLALENVKIRAELIEAERDIAMIGASDVTVEKVTEGEETAADVRVKAGRNINISLKPGGSVTVNVDQGLLPFMAEKKITLGNSDKILVPQNGVARGEDTPYGPDCYFIFDENDDWDSDVIIKNTEEE